MAHRPLELVGENLETRGAVGREALEHYKESFMDHSGRSVEDKSAQRKADNQVGAHRFQR